ncbi:hypothetical protein [Poseidonocella pacifica]|nr:hypothetical protein [Poseidonocella pacifica]
MEDDVLAIVAPSPVRRALGVGMFFGLGVLLVVIALGQNFGGFGWQAFTLLCGAGALALGEKMRRATRNHVILRPEGLFDAQGREIARLDTIARVERGVFAFKPSNGFTIVTKVPQGANAWAPGLWWRLGRRIGIGGVTPSGQAKFMAEMIAELLVIRPGTEPEPRP